jgi:hypothetical protein
MTSANFPTTTRPANWVTRLDDRLISMAVTARGEGGKRTTKESAFQRTATGDARRAIAGDWRRVGMFVYRVGGGGGGRGHQDNANSRIHVGSGDGVRWTPTTKGGPQAVAIVDADRVRPLNI